MLCSRLCDQLPQTGLWGEGSRGKKRNFKKKETLYYRIWKRLLMGNLEICRKKYRFSEQSQIF